MAEVRTSHELASQVGPAGSRARTDVMIGPFALPGRKGEPHSHEDRAALQNTPLTRHNLLHISRTTQAKAVRIRVELWRLFVADPVGQQWPPLGDTRAVSRAYAAAMRPRPSEVLHFSEDPYIATFAPHVARTAADQIPTVWAVDTTNAPSYWFPRQCPERWPGGLRRPPLAISSESSVRTPTEST